MSRLLILAALMMALALALPGGTEATSLNELKKLTDSNGQSFDTFGAGVAVSGDTAVVGADSEDAGGSDVRARRLSRLTGVAGREVGRLADRVELRQVVGIVDALEDVPGAAMQFAEHAVRRRRAERGVLGQRGGEGPELRAVEPQLAAQLLERQLRRVALLRGVRDRDASELLDVVQHPAGDGDLMP